jgi:predicted ATPase
MNVCVAWLPSAVPPGGIGLLPFNPARMTWRVSSLSCRSEAGHRSEAVTPFFERARSVVPAFVLDETSEAKVQAICERLDGIPLAIELAAPRVRLLSVVHVYAKLDDRFRLLTGGSRTALE